MTSTKSNVETINPFKDTFEVDGSVNRNRIRDTVISAVELSKRTKVPMLFFSNPGYGKTTTIYNIAKRENRHVEVVCGSQYSQDEILGFQTNEPGQASLVIKEPEWYSRIMDNHKNGKSSILFLDELSTVCGATQGALLQLCFERRIRGGKALPDDCLVIAAANYKTNLPGYSEIIAPTLNRFCIINLLPGSASEAVAEFTQGISETQEFWPEFSNNEVGDAMRVKIVEETSAVFSQMFTQYSAGSNRGFLDIRNTRYDGIYDRDDSNPEVLNFISGRTMSYLTRCIIGMVEMGLDSNSDIFNKMIDGLIGLGTNTWSPNDEVDVADGRLAKYLNDIHGRFSRVLDKQVAKFNTKKTEEAKKALNRLNELMGKDTVSNRITAFVANDDMQKYMGTEWTSLFEVICKTYGTDNFAKHLEEIFADEKHIMLFKSDMDCIETLIEDTDEANNTIGSVRPYCVELDKIHTTYKFYYEAACLTLNK